MLKDSPHLFELLAHDVRWHIMQDLLESDMRVNEIVESTQSPINGVSYHLRKLRDAELVKARRSDVDGRDIYYSINLDMLYKQFVRVGQSLGFELQHLHSAVTAGPLRVLFVCTQNSMRSQLAEALMRYHGGQFVEVMSAGTQPTVVHPLVTQTLARMGIRVGQLQSKHVEDFRDDEFDYIITVCDYARTICPPIRSDKSLHWGLADPAGHDDPSLRHEAFFKIAQQLDARVRYFLHTREAISSRIQDDE